MEPCGYSIPPGRVWPTAGSESCVRQGRPGARSVDSESAELGYRASKLYCSREPTSLWCTGAASLHRTGLVPRSRRGLRTERAGTRVLQEPERPVHLRRTDRLGSAEPETSRPPAGRPWPVGAKNGRSAGTAYANPISPAGGMGRGRSAFILPAKRGNHSRRGPRGGKEGVESSNRWGETCRRHRTPISCARNASG